MIDKNANQKYIVNVGLNNKKQQKIEKTKL